MTVGGPEGTAGLPPNWEKYGEIVSGEVQSELDWTTGWNEATKQAPEWDLNQRGTW
jgi:hypothetical protein